MRHTAVFLCSLVLQVGPTIEFSRGDIFDDEEIAKILPFLALPDGAHLVRFMLFILLFCLSRSRLWRTTLIST